MSATRPFTTFGRCQLHRTAEICDGALIGKPFRRLLDGTQEPLAKKTVVGRQAYIGHNAIVGNGSTISDRAIVDDFCIIESRVVVGRKSLVIYRAQICNEALIGDECVIGGFVGERTQVGNRCRIFGQVVHLQHEPHKGWDDEEVSEPAATIRDDAFIGFGALVAGGISIGRNAYVCSRAIVTKDVPTKNIAYGVNQFVPFFKWKGRLRRSEFFRA